jgi:hypothetical protein
MKLSFRYLQEWNQPVGGCNILIEFDTAIKLSPEALILKKQNQTVAKIKGSDVNEFFKYIYDMKLEEL